MPDITQNDRIEAVFDQIIQFSKLDFETKGIVSGKGDELDSIIAGLNFLGEELNAKNEERINDKKRMSEHLEVLLKYTSMNFSEKALISEKGDDLDAFAAGINALVEELEYRLRQIRESEEHFRLLVENVKEYAICMIDKKGVVVSWNKGAEHIKGYTEKEIIGKHISIFYTPEEIKRKEPQYNLKKAKELGRYKCEAWRVGKNGIKFWADVTFTAIYDDEGKIHGFSKITRDITDRKMAELKLQEKGEELIRSNAELEQFAYVASHDLQEPLRMITSYVQLLEKRYKDKLDEDANEFINYAVDGSNRMRILINSLLEYSRVNRIKPFEHINTSELLKDVLQNLRDQINQNAAVIQVNELPNIYGDPVLINQLFQNLISNAIKFKSTQAPEIIISCEKGNNEYFFKVKDNGIGIKKEYANKIFVIFQRLHSKDKYPGTGIGLAICKKIVERHSGMIWVESEINEGSTFCFTIKEK